MKSSKLATELQLPCGVKLKNRIAKSAMSENMANSLHNPDQKFELLYERWAKGGSGLIITGNVMCDLRYLGEPNNVVVEADSFNLESLKSWAIAGTKNQTAIWMQINHPGKQSPKFLSKEPVSPSAIPLKPPLDRLFNCPRALTETEILNTIERFVFSSKVAKQAGFSGVQIHGAHGYLVSQFLSPLHNQRSDRWGGTLENRMRFVLEIYRSMRKELGASFPIGIKLNSADFQKGGFNEDESLKVVQNLSAEGMDLIEISGGNYEMQEMMGTTATRSQSTELREAYFIQYCEKIRDQVKTPLMLTGGFRTSRGMQAALESNACDIIGLGRSLVLKPDFANDILEGAMTTSMVKPITTGIKALDRNFPLEIIWYTEQIHRLGKGQETDLRLSPLVSIVRTLFSAGSEGLKRVRAK